MTLFILEGLKPLFCMHARKIFKNNSRLYTEVYDPLFSVCFWHRVLSRLQKDPKLSNRFIFRGSMVCPRTNWPWITGRRWTDSFKFWFSLNKCWKRELVHGWSITQQYTAVKAWNKLGFVHNTSSPDSDADLEYNWKTCRKRKKYNVWSLIKFF